MEISHRRLRFGFFGFFRVQLLTLLLLVTSCVFVDAIFLTGLPCRTDRMWELWCEMWQEGYWLIATSGMLLSIHVGLKPIADSLRANPSKAPRDLPSTGISL